MVRLSRLWYDIREYSHAIKVPCMEADKLRSGKSKRKPCRCRSESHLAEGVDMSAFSLCLPGCWS